MMPGMNDPMQLIRILLGFATVYYGTNTAFALAHYFAQQ
jgi:hypothetical protein